MKNMTGLERVEDFLSRLENEASLSAGNFVDDKQKLNKLRKYRELMQETKSHKSPTTECVRRKARLLLRKVYANLGREATYACMLASTITELGHFKDNEIPALISEMQKRWGTSTSRSPILATSAASFLDEKLVVSFSPAIQRDPRSSFQNSGEPNPPFDIGIPLICRRQQCECKCPNCLERAWLVFGCAPN